MKAKLTKSGKVKLVMDIDDARTLAKTFRINSPSDFQSMGADSPHASDLVCDQIDSALNGLDLDGN